MELEAKKNGLQLEIDRKEFALELKTWRLRQGLTQKEVAMRWGTNRYIIIKAEAAKPISWEAAYRLFVKLNEELRNEVHYNNRPTGSTPAL